MIPCEENTRFDSSEDNNVVSVCGEEDELVPCSASFTFTSSLLVVVVLGGANVAVVVTTVVMLDVEEYDRAHLPIEGGHEEA